MWLHGFKKGRVPTTAPWGNWICRLDTASLAHYPGFPNSCVADGITVEELVVLSLSFLMWEQRLGVD